MGGGWGRGEGGGVRGRREGGGVSGRREGGGVRRRERGSFYEESCVEVSEKEGRYAMIRIHCVYPPSRVCGHLTCTTFSLAHMHVEANMHAPCTCMWKLCTCMQ